jgi:hypothetical protein
MSQQINVSQPATADPLHEYRIGKLEEAVTSLACSMEAIADTVKSARWAIAIIFGVAQPVGVALLVRYMGG